MSEIGTYHWVKSDQLSKLLLEESGGGGTFGGGGEFIQMVEEKIRRRASGYPACHPWFCGFVRVVSLGGLIKEILGATEPVAVKRKVIN